jgi:hypothetical protein
LDGNGKRDKDEPALTGIIVMVGKKKLKTDINGDYSISLRAKKALVRVDEKTLPENFILTTPSSQEVDLTLKSSQVNFGASSFAGIYGVVFYDINSNGKFDPTVDAPLINVKLSLENQEAVTNFEGAYYYRHLKEGSYLLKLDLDSVPIEYLPAVPLMKQIDLVEGANYQYSFPMKKK